MVPERIIKRYIYQGRELGRLVKLGSGDIEYVSDFGVLDLEDLVLELSPEERIHLKARAYPVYKLLIRQGLNPNTYIDDNDVFICIANQGFRTLTALNRGDYKLWELVKQRGLKQELLNYWKGE